MATRMSYASRPMRPALRTRLPARTTVMPIVMVGALTAMLLLLPLTLLIVAQHSARRSSVSATQAVPTDLPIAPIVPQPVEDRSFAPLPAVPDLSSPAVAEVQAPFALVSSPDTQGTDGQQV